MAVLALVVVLGGASALIGHFQTGRLATAFRDEVLIHERVGRFRTGLFEYSQGAYASAVSHESDGRRALAERYEALKEEARRCDKCHLLAGARARVEDLLVRTRKAAEALLGAPMSEATGIAHTRELLGRYESASRELGDALGAMERRFEALGDRQSALGVEAMDRSSLQFWLFIAGAVLLAVAATVWLARSLSAPIRDLSEAARRIGAGDRTYRVQVPRDPDLAELAREFGEMATKVEQRAHEAALSRLLDRVITSQEEERKRIARELHDQVGQSLVALLIRLRSEAPRGVDTAGSEKLVLEVLDQVRRMAWDLRPSILTDHGLDAALTRYVEQKANDHGATPIDFHFGCDAGVPPRFDESLELVLYRVAQEAIRNAVAHAGASRISTVVVRERSQATLIVEDDGKGFDAKEVRGSGKGSLGLMGMEERVALAGGELTITTSPGAGCTVRARIPTHPLTNERGQECSSAS